MNWELWMEKQASVSGEDRKLQEGVPVYLYCMCSCMNSV